MPLPYDHLGGWEDAIALYVNEQLKAAVGLFSATSNTRNPVLSCGYRLLDSDHNGTVNISDAVQTLRAQADLNKWNGPASATNQTGGPHFFRVINEQSSSWTYDYAQLIVNQQWNTTVDGLIPAEFDAPNPTTGSDGMSMRMIKAEFGNRGAGGLTLQSTNQYTISGGPGSSTQNQFTGESSNNTNNSEGNAVFQANSDGTVYYKIRTSSEANYDFSRIKLGSTQQDSCSGNNVTAEGSFAVSAGDSIEVEYTKDGSVSSFNDKGYLDYLYMVGSGGTGQGIPISAYYGADTDAPYDTPTSGELKWSDFYGAAAAETFFEIDRFNPANSTSWVTRTIAWENTDVGAPLSVNPPTLGRIVFRWQNGNASTSYRGDFQLAWFAFMEGANIIRRWGFNGDVNIPSYQQSLYEPGQYTTSDPGHYGYIGEGWEYYYSTSAVTESEYENLDSSRWREIGSDSNNQSTINSYRWNRDTGGTPSTLTGVTSNHAYGSNSYLYAETSGSNTLGAYYWVRSPVFKLDDNMFTNNCDIFSYQYGAYGVNCPSGECTVYLEKLSYPVYTNTLWAVGHNTGSNFSGNSWPQDYTFTYYFIDMQEFENSTGWGIYEYINGPSLGEHYTGDIQIDDTAFNGRGNNMNAPVTTSYPEDHHFRATGQTVAQTTRSHNFLQKHIDGDLGWERINVAYSTTQYQWNVDYGGTPSAGTGLNDDYDGGSTTSDGYAYAETSGTNTDGFHYYMRTNRGENYGIQRYWYFRFAGVGANCGTLNCRLLLDGEED